MYYQPSELEVEKRKDGLWLTFGVVASLGRLSILYGLRRQEDVENYCLWSRIWHIMAQDPLLWAHGGTMWDS